jgi:tetrahydromethanopterin S-methyltransferase subunit A
VLKLRPDPSYPPEEGRYVRGNDFSPVAVAVILNRDADKIPTEVQSLVRAAAESGAALAGTVQTPNIGFEKMICNVVANPNIRHLILGGPESEGHLTGEALKALMTNGVDDKQRIIGTEAPHAALFNLPMEVIDRFRSQVSLVDLQFEGDPDVLRQAVWACYQEAPVEFRGYRLHDPGAYPDPPINCQVVWRATRPWAEPPTENEREAMRRARELIDRLKARDAPKGPPRV